MADGINVRNRGEEKSMEPPYEDYCYECKGYCDDYYIDDDGEMKCRCPECPYFEGGEEHETD